VCRCYTRKVHSCVHTYTKTTYDVHAVFSVHVCHSHKHCIALCVYYCMIIYFPHDFQDSLRCIPTRYIQLMSTTTLGILLEYHMVAWHKNCLDDDISANIRQVYRHIITRTVCQGIYVLLLLLLHDGALMLTYFHSKYSLYTMLKFPQVLCIQNVYTWYIFGKHHSTTCIQYVYIAFSFFSATYTTIIPLYVFKHHIFLLSQSLVDACLWVARLRGGLVRTRL